MHQHGTVRAPLDASLRVSCLYIYVRHSRRSPVLYQGRPLTWRFFSSQVRRCWRWPPPPSGVWRRAPSSRIIMALTAVAVSSCFTTRTVRSPVAAVDGLQEPEAISAARANIRRPLCPRRPSCPLVSFTAGRRAPETLTSASSTTTTRCESASA